VRERRRARSQEWTLVRSLVCAPMVRSSPRLLLAVLVLLVLTGLVSGCGKTLPQTASHPGGSGAGLPALTGGGIGGVITKNTTRVGGTEAIADAASVALAVYPGLTPTTRPGVVVMVDRDDWPVALAASTLAGSPLHAPILYREGDTLPGASEQALRTMRPTGAPTLNNAQVLQIGTSAAVAGYRTRSLASGPLHTDPYATAAKIEETIATLTGKPPRQVIVAAADGPPSLAMPAAGLAAQSGAPILLVNASDVPAATAMALDRLHRPSIYAIGPPSAIGEAVLSRLRHYGHVTRVQGANASSNAIAVARFSDGSFGWNVNDPGHGLVFANASRPLDAPAAALLSDIGDYGPLLLLEQPNSVPADLSTYLNGIQPGYTEAPEYRPVHGVYNHGWLIGDEQAMTSTVQAELDALLEISPRGTTETPATSPEPSEASATSTSATTPSSGSHAPTTSTTPATTSTRATTSSPTTTSTSTSVSPAITPKTSTKPNDRKP
jgi:hypothetical protein